ncbi:glycine cleavage system aminomethyltransferase GcvT [Planctomonas sp. JC2975]|uniref:glycine cleavage system aminomethyltransferase GcvT n=1 Tax=Planctomonas sp. JC2975 TaxID=2729626 RepID=UPI001474627E|nr:glycine cleavage system aminomethyltransferase GcvT [Planctomonas sp. JC2975]NNC11222.1 glycine cleavage system aminomethyltransferase GcvT [Planctomonas sp. JC2975]
MAQVPSSSGTTERPTPPENTERLSPLNDAHVAAGASFTDFAGWQMPVRYSSDLAEHHAVRTAAGLFDLSHMGEIVVIGPQAADALDHALAGRLSALEQGQAKYSLLLDESGGILDDLVVYRTGADRYLVVANAANRQTVADALVQRATSFQADVYDESDDIALIAIQGPRALEILQNVEELGLEAGADLPEDREDPDIDNALAALKYYRSLSGTFQDHPVLIARTGYTGEDGFELYVAPDNARALWDALLETGAGAGLVPAGLASRDTLRLEAGMPLYGHELSTRTLPSQAGLGRVVALAKPDDFVGREAIEQGVPSDARVLVGLMGDGKRAARAGYQVYARASDEAAVGEITSGALSPTLAHPIALAYVDPALAATGTELDVDVRGTRIPFSVTELPFYSRKKN